MRYCSFFLISFFLFHHVKNGSDIIATFSSAEDRGFVQNTCKAHVNEYVNIRLQGFKKQNFQNLKSDWFILMPNDDKTMP